MWRGAQNLQGQAYVLIRRREIRALKIGGRGTWRVGLDDLEVFIQRTYKETERMDRRAPVQGERQGRRDPG